MFWQTEHKKNASPEELTFWLFYYKGLLSFGYTQLVFFLIDRNITKIVDIELKGLYERIEAIGYKMVVDDEAKRFLAAKGYDVQFGARPLKRAIQNYLEDGLSELIVSAGLQPGDTVNVSVDKEKDELSITKA